MKILLIRKILITNSFYIILLFLCLFLFIINLNINHKKVSLNQSFLVEHIKQKEESLSLVLKGKEGKINCIYYLKSRKISLSEGTTIKIIGKKNIIKNNTIPNAFNYRNYLKSKKIFETCTIKNITSIKKNKSLFYKTKYFIKNRINSNVKNKGYMHTFILGNNSYLDEDTIEKYRGNGLSHLFAISGMHINFFALILIRIFKKIKIDEDKIYIGVILIIWFYAFLTGFSGSVIRAGMFFTILMINKIFVFEIKTINALILTLFIIMVYNPLILYDISFLYSFMSTLGLIYGIKRNILFSSIYANIFTIPITINNFHIINFLSIIISPIFSFLVASIIYPLTIITFFVKPLNNLLFIWTNFLEILNDLCFKFVLLKFSFKNLNVLLICLYYIFLFSLINKHFLKCISLLIFILTFNNITPYFNNIIYIEFIDVSQGDEVLIRLKKSALLIDTGGAYGKKVSISKNTIDYLKSIGITKIRYLITTHGDFDHMGEAINLVNNFKVEKVIFNCGEFNDLEQELIKVLDKKKIPYYSCIKELNIDNNKLYFLQTKLYDNENDNSNVIYTELDGYKFMFMGDASITTEKEILDKYNISDIDVLKVGHHGSKTSSSKEFINEINPRYSVISVGKNNRYGHPNKEVLDNLKDSKIYRTDQDGSIMFKIENNKLKIETCES